MTPSIKYIIQAWSPELDLSHPLTTRHDSVHMESQIWEVSKNRSPSLLPGRLANSRAPGSVRNTISNSKWRRHLASTSWFYIHVDTCTHVCTNRHTHTVHKVTVNKIYQTREITLTKFFLNAVRMIFVCDVWWVLSFVLGVFMSYKWTESAGNT